MAAPQPKRPNVLVTGTPATGKTSTAELIAQELGMKHVEVGKVIKEERFFSEYDPVLDTRLIEESDEDRLLDFLEPMMVEGGVVADYHSCELFPERWFSTVVVLRTSTNTLFERLSARGYSEAKIDENMEAEICGVVEEEARGAYREEILFVRESNNLDDMAATVDLVMERVRELNTE